MSARLRNERRAEVLKASLAEVGIDPAAIVIDDCGCVRYRRSAGIDTETLWRAYLIALQVEPTHALHPPCLACFISFTATKDRAALGHCASPALFTPDCGSRSDSPVEVTQ